MDADSLTAHLKKLALEFPPGILRPGQTFDDHISNTVVNLSDLALTQVQIELLGKGLTFCPSSPDLSQIWLDFKDLHRRLELRQFFKDIGTPDNTQDDLGTKFAPRATGAHPFLIKL
jgi:hypothetical protein